MQHRIQRSLAFGALCAVLAGSATAAGTISTDGAVLETGSAPTQGVVTVDPAAPAAELPSVPLRRPLGSMGTFTVPFPRFPSGETGETAFRADASLTLAAGTHRFTTFEVAAGAVVTCEGSVTIRTSGAVAIDGEVRILEPGDLRLACGGDLSLGLNAVVGAEMGSLRIDALGGVSAAGGALLRGRQGVTVRAHGRDGVAGDVVLAGASLSATAGSHLVQAAGSIVLSDGAATYTVSGDTAVQAFGGDVTFSGGSAVSMTGAPDAVRVEAAGSVTFTGAGTGVHATGADVRIRAFGGGLTLADGASLHVTGGQFDFGARGTVAITGGTEVRTTSGGIRLTSFEGDVRVAFAGTGAWIGGTIVDVTIVAAGSIEIAGDGEFGGNQGDLRIEAHGGDVTLHGGTRFGTRGALEVLASGSVTIDEVDVWYGSVVLSAETGRIGLTGTRSIATRTGSFRAVAASHLLVRTHVSSFGDLSLASRDGTVDVGGQTIETSSPIPISDRSGSISIESFGGAAGQIEARGAVVRTASADGASGDVVLAVHDGVLPSPDEGFLVPETVIVDRDLRHPERSVFDVAGVVDTGTAPLGAGDVTVTVGGDAHPLVLVARRRRLTARAPGVRLELRPDASGSSRARFRVRRTGYVEELLTVDGSSPVAIGLQADATDSSSLVRPLSGRYRRGGRGEALTDPAILPSRIRARLAVGPADSLAFEVELGRLGAVPASAPDVRVTFGGAYTADLPSSAFVPGGDSVFVATDPLPGVRRVVLDYVSSTLVFEASGIELGEPGEPGDAADGLATVLGVAVGGDAGAVRLRLGRRRGRFEY